MSQQPDMAEEDPEEPVQYGLPEQRDSDTGELKPVDHTYPWGETDITIRIIPPTISQLQEYEEMDDDMSVEELEEVVGEHLIEPDVPVADMSARELNCYVEGIMSYGSQEGQIGRAIQQELASRQTGNPT